MFTDQLPTFPENFVQIPSEFFLRKVANEQADKQTNNDDYTSSVSEA